MRAILLLVPAIVVAASWVNTAPVVEALGGPTPYFFYNSFYNVTANGTTELRTDGVNAWCRVDMHTRLGNGTAGLNFTASVMLDANCRPSLNINNVSGTVLWTDGTYYYAEVHNIQRDVVTIAMTDTYLKTQWASPCDLCPPVYGVNEWHGEGHLNDGWQVAAHSGGWTDPGCQIFEGECYHVSAEAKTTFYYPSGFFYPLCPGSGSDSCRHNQDVYFDSWWQYDSLSCHTYGNVPYGSKQDCQKSY